MFSMEDCHVIQSSLDNLLSLKLMHEAGYRVSDMGYWVTDYSFENTGGNIFLKILERLFGTCVEEEEGTYDVKFVVMCPDVEELLDMFTKDWVEQQLRCPNKVVCDQMGSEMMIELNTQGITIEIQESPIFFHQFVEELLRIRRSIDKLLVVAQYQKGNRGASHVAFYSEIH